MRRECRERCSPPPTSKETASKRSRHASRHVGDARAVMHIGIANPRWWGKRSRHSRRMRNPRFYLSGKRSMDCGVHVVHVCTLTSIIYSGWLWKMVHRPLLIQRGATGFCYCRYFPIWFSNYQNTDYRSSITSTARRRWHGQTWMLFTRSNAYFKSDVSMTG